MGWFFLGLVTVLTGASLALLYYSVYVWAKYKLHEWSIAALLSLMLSLLFGHMFMGTWDVVVNVDESKAHKEISHTEKYQIVETTEGKFIPYEIASITGTKCIGSDGSEWGLKYEDEYCIYDDEKSAREAIHASIVRYYTVHKSKHTPQRIIGIE